jgi:dUTP pyrophosphatase
MNKIKIVNKSTNKLPEYATIHSAGMDLMAYIPDRLEITLNPMERKMIHTGIYIKLPEGYEAQIRPRSGLAIKYGVTVINTPGTIDSDYIGEVCVLLVNLSDKPFDINHGDRIAQMVINKYEVIDWDVVDELEQTERGTGGFGHTGK